MFYHFINISDLSSMWGLQQAFTFLELLAEEILLALQPGFYRPLSFIFWFRFLFHGGWAHQIVMSKTTAPQGLPFLYAANYSKTGGSSFLPTLT